MRTTGLILAGGEGQRLGRPKALVRFRGEPLLGRVARVLEPLVDELLIAVREPLAGEVELAGRGRLVVDSVSGIGALAGLLAGLRAATGDRLVAVAVDMPFLSQPLLREMLRISREAAYAAVVPAPRPSHVEPLHAIYEPAATGAAALRAIAAGNVELQALLRDPALAVRFVSPSEMRRFDPDGLSLLNVNTPEDLARAEALVDRKD